MYNVNEKYEKYIEEFLKEGFEVINFSISRFTDNYTFSCDIVATSNEEVLEKKGRVEILELRSTGEKMVSFKGSVSSRGEESEFLLDSLIFNEDGSSNVDYFNLDDSRLLHPFVLTAKASKEDLSKLTISKDYFYCLISKYTAETIEEDQLDLLNLEYGDIVFNMANIEDVSTFASFIEMENKKLSIDSLDLLALNYKI